MRGARREVHAGDVDLQIDESGEQPRARLSFISAAGEAVELDVAGIGPPDVRGAGLTDPGEHSPAVKVLRPGLTACEGFMTRGHSLGVIRAGQVRMERLASPSTLTPGAEWAFEVEGRSVVYRIVERSTEDELKVERQGAGREIVTVRASGSQLELNAVAVPDQSGMTLKFADGRFEISVESRPALVAGEVLESAGGVTLLPETPDWARRRPMRVEINADARGLTFTTTVGAAAINA
jgi:hypothetical protein